MNNLGEKLKELPPEFTMAIEEAKDKNFESSLQYILNKLDIVDGFNELDDETKSDFIEFLKLIYMFGFYSGVDFTLQPYDFLDIIDVHIPKYTNIVVTYKNTTVSTLTKYCVCQKLISFLVSYIYLKTDSKYSLISFLYIFTSA